MAVKCERCTADVTDGAPLCHRCGVDLVQLLRAVPGVVADLLVVHARQDRTGPPTPPIHSLAIRASHGPHLRGDADLTRLADLIMETARAVATQLALARLPIGQPGLRQITLNNRASRTDAARPSDRTALSAGPSPIEQMAIWLACHPHALRRYPDAASLLRRLTDTMDRLTDAIDPRPRRYLGPCPTIARVDEYGRTITCGYRLLAPANPDRRSLRCARCHAHYLVADLESAALARATEGLWTLAELHEHVLPAVGAHIARATLYRWAGRRRVVPRGYQHTDGRISDHREHPDDPAVYRLGDILALAHNATTAPRKAGP